MSTQTRGQLPRGELLGRYRTYEDAQKVVDHLAQAEGFDLKGISIVGNDLRSVENVRARLTYPRVAGMGAAQGAMFGFFIGLLIFLFSPEAPMLNLLMSVVLGMAIWMIIGVIGFAVRRGQRDFASSTQLIATTYDVVCDFSSAGRARQIAAGSGVQSLNAFNDPTGQSAQLAGQSTQLGPQPPQQEQAGEQRPKPSPNPTGYGTLPDGRPRYGVRKEDVQKTAETTDDASIPVNADPESPDSENAAPGNSAPGNPRPESSGPESPGSERDHSQS